MEVIPVFKPLIEQEEIEASREALEMGWLGMGSYVGQFEVKIKEFIGAHDRFVATVNTGMAAESQRNFRERYESCISAARFYGNHLMRCRFCHNELTKEFVNSGSCRFKLSEGIRNGKGFLR